MKKIGGILSTVVIIGLMTIAFTLFILRLSGESLNNLPVQISQIMTGSMEPTLHAPTKNKRGKTISGDVVIIYKCEIEKIEVEDIVAYFSDINNDGTYEVVVHRVKELTDSYIRIVGDQEGTLDEILSYDEFSSRFLGKILFNRKAYIITWLFRVLTQGWGFLTFIVLPMLLIIFKQIIKIVLISKHNKEVSLGTSVELNGVVYSEDEIKKMIEEKKKTGKD